MAGPIRISVLADVRQAVRSVTKFSETVDTETKRVADTLGDSKVGFAGRMRHSFTKLGENLTESLGNASSKLPGIMSGAVSSLPPQGQAIALVLVAGLAVSLAPLIAAALTTAILGALGGGVLIAGIASAARNPAVKAAFGDLGKTAKGIFTGLGGAFLGPLVRAAGTFNRMLKEVAPQITELGTIIAPVIDTLAPALAEMFKNTLPGIKDAVEASVPLFETLAEHLPEIGTAISKFLTTIAEHGPEAAVFFGDMLDLVALLIVVFGVVISHLTRFYVWGRRAALGVASAVRWLWNRLGELASAVKSLPGKIKAAFGNVGSLLKDAGRRLLRGFIDGIKSAFGDVQSTLGDLTGRLTSWKGPPSRDRKLLLGAGRQVMGGFLGGLESRYAEVRQSLGGFTGGLSAEAAVGGTVSVNTASAPAWAQRLIALLDGGLKLTLESSGNRGDDALIELIRERMRIKGGKASILGIR